MYLNERFVIIVAGILLSVGAACLAARKTARGGFILCLSTPILTGILLWFYYYRVQEPSHGVAILILPLTTAWLWWRRQMTGRPAGTIYHLLLGQALFGLLYWILIQIQEG